MTLAAYLYKRVVDTWNAQTFSKFQFPRIVKADWPTIYKVKYAEADLLYFQQKWAECGPAFDAVVAENPQAPEAAEAAYASVLCYQNIYEQQHPKGSERKSSGNLPKLNKDEKAKAAAAAEEAKFKPKDMTEQQKGMISAFNKYICYIHPAASDQQGQEQLVEVKFARARTYFEAQHWEESAAAFLDVATNNSDRDVGIYAAQLYLESVNVLASHDTAVTSQPPNKRLGCYDDMAADVPKFIELYCSADKIKKNEEQCGILNRIQVDILRLKAEATVKKADSENGSTDSLRAYENAGTQYLDLYRKYCETPIRNGQQPQAEKCDELVYNAAKAFQAGRLLAKAIAARMILLNPMNHMDKSPLAKKSVYEIGGNYQAIAVYDQAADWYERYACVPDVHKNRVNERDCNAKAEKADDAVKDAVLLRLGIGDEAQAIEDASVLPAQVRRRARQDRRANRLLDRRALRRQGRLEHVPDRPQGRDGPHRQGRYRRAGASARDARPLLRAREGHAGRPAGVREGARSVEGPGGRPEEARLGLPGREPRGAQPPPRQGARRGRRGDLLRRRREEARRGRRHQASPSTTGRERRTTSSSTSKARSPTG